MGIPLRYNSGEIPRKCCQRSLNASNQLVTPAHDSPTTARAQSRGLPVRVALIAPSPRAIGGQAAQAQFLLRQWSGDPSVGVTFVPSDPPLSTPFGWAESIPYLRTILRFFTYCWRLWWELRGHDVVHVFSASYWSFLLVPLPARVISRIRGSKTLLHYHSGEAKDHLQRWPSAIRWLRKMDTVVVPSEYLSAVMADFGVSAKIIANGIDSRRFSYKPRTVLRPNLLCTRAFEPYYRVDLVIRAFARVKEQFPDARLSLVGSGSCERQIRQLVKELHLSNCVQFVGAVPNEEIHRYYADSDVYINASLLDNMPISILEAFASGVVLASTAPDGIRYLVEHEATGLLCHPGDWEGLANNVVRLLSDPSLSSRLSRNAAQICERYKWKNLRKDWLEVYSSLSSRQSSGSSIQTSESHSPTSLQAGVNGSA